MKLSEMIKAMQAIVTAYGDLEVLDDDHFTIRSVESDTFTKREADEYDVTEGERYARIVSNY